MITVLCPGQGAQKKGFLAPWLEEENARQWLAQASEQVGIDLLRHGTTSDEEVLRDTRITQPLIVAIGILVIHNLYKILGHTPSDLNGRLPAFADRRIGFAGHSVGEITAAAGAGILSASEALRFVKHRADYMCDASKKNATAMVAVLGKSAGLAEKYRLFPANYNCDGQLVLAGARENIDCLLKASPPGTRLVPLKVSGAFHTRYMRPAQERLRKLEFSCADPVNTIWTNYDGSQVTSGKEYLQLLVNQVTNPVRWDLCQKNFVDSKCLVEVSPAGTLINLAKRSLPGVPTLGINNPGDLEQIKQYLSVRG